MNIMRPLSAVFVVVSLSLAPVRAQDKGAAPAPQGAETYEVVKKEYTDAVRTWSKEYRAAREEAKKNGKDEPFHFDKSLPDARFAPRFLAIAERNPEGPDAIDALCFTLWNSQAPRSGADPDDWPLLSAELENRDLRPCVSSRDEGPTSRASRGDPAHGHMLPDAP